MDRLHCNYLTAITWAALADGVALEAERQKLDRVATLLHLLLGAVEDALTYAAGVAPAR
ncbi:hypothetical protein [Planotetraspora sp. GP83]|uniref:hypothetical protein n=1 Tax=Planotetraspora sp. GP83 TaxID=3156264 RepID=UPI0035199208